MLNLLASDLYRIMRPRGLRGTFWQYTIAIAAVYAMVAGLFVFATSPWAVNQGFASAELETISNFASPTKYFCDMIGGIVPLCIAFMVTEHALADFKQGYAKTVLTARRGRLSYFAGRIVLAGVISLVMLAVGLLACVVCAIALDATFAQLDAPLAIVQWFVGYWLNCWALAALALILVYATRVNAVSYIGAFCLTAGVIPSVITGVIHLSESMLRILAPVRPVLETLVAWMPSTALGKLGYGAALFTDTPADLWSNLPQAATLDPAVQVVLTGAIWIAVASALVLALARSRDV